MFVMFVMFVMFCSSLCLGFILAVWSFTLCFDWLSRHSSCLDYHLHCELTAAVFLDQPPSFATLIGSSWRPGKSSRRLPPKSRAQVRLVVHSCSAPASIRLSACLCLPAVLLSADGSFAGDFSNFDPEFTSEKPVLTPEDPKRIAGIDQVCGGVLRTCFTS